MLHGSIVAVLSATGDKAKGIAKELGKEKESGVFYRKSGEFLVSILAVGMDEISEAANAASMANFIVVDYLPGSREHAEAALLAEATGAEGSVVTEFEEDFRKTFNGLRISNYKLGLTEPPPLQDDLGVVPIDQAFVVKGVGTVVLGFALTYVKVHDQVFLLPSMKSAEVKSIQVLDVDYEEVGPGVRVGLALKGVDEKEAKMSYAIAKYNAKLGRSIGIERRFPWAPEARSLHAFTKGIKAFGNLADGLVEVEKQLPVGARAALINLNAPAGKLRVYGSGVVKD